MGGPEKDQILWHCLVQGLAIIHHLVQILLQGVFQGQVQVSWAVVRFLQSGDSIMCKGQFRVSVPLIIMILPFNFQVLVQGTSGSSVLSEESWLGSTGDGLLASADSVILFFSVHLLLLTESPCFSMTFFFLAYCLPPTLCSHFLDIALCMALNDSPHFLVTSLIFLA